MNKRKRTKDTFIAAVEAGIVVADRGRLIAHDDVVAAVRRRHAELKSRQNRNPDSPLSPGERKR